MLDRLFRNSSYVSSLTAAAMAVAVLSVHAQGAMAATAAHPSDVAASSRTLAVSKTGYTVLTGEYHPPQSAILTDEYHPPQSSVLTDEYHPPQNSVLTNEYHPPQN